MVKHHFLSPACHAALRMRGFLGIPIHGRTLMSYSQQCLRHAFLWQSAEAPGQCLVVNFVHAKSNLKLPLAEVIDGMTNINWSHINLALTCILY